MLNPTHEIPDRLSTVADGDNHGNFGSPSVARRFFVPFGSPSVAQCFLRALRALRSPSVAQRFFVPSCPSGRRPSLSVSSCPSCPSCRRPSPDVSSCPSCPSGRRPSLSVSSCPSCPSGRRPSLSVSSYSSCPSGRRPSLSVSSCPSCPSCRRPSPDVSSCPSCSRPSAPPVCSRSRRVHQVNRSESAEAKAREVRTGRDIRPRLDAARCRRTRAAGPCDRAGSSP